MINVCCVPVQNEDEAETLVAHHLMLAATYFEATSKNPKIPKNEFSTPAMNAWFAAMETLYPEEGTDQ